jgi:hypothetical protein
VRVIVTHPDSFEFHRALQVDTVYHDRWLLPVAMDATTGRLAALCESINRKSWGAAQDRELEAGHTQLQE